MTSLSPVPHRLRTPSWFDMRLLLGVVLVVGSVAFGAIVMSRANSTRPLLAVDRDLAAGTVLADDDLRTVRVRISGNATDYLARGSAVSGKVLLRALGAGELLPASAIGSADPGETTLTVPVKPENAPDIERGQRITVWVSTQYCQAVQVLGDVAVQDVRRAGNGALSAASQESLVVRVPRVLAERVVTALGLDAATIRVGVLTGTVAGPANTGLPDLAGCLAPARAS